VSGLPAPWRHCVKAYNVEVQQLGDRIQVSGDELLVSSTWPEQACRQVEQWQVVIARNSQHGVWQPLQEFSSLEELAPASTLSQIARDDHEVRATIPNVGKQ
jgi:hypothetical protein